MKSRKSVLTLVSILLFPLIPAINLTANATAPSPKIIWDCQLMRLSDEDGPFVFFDPREQIVKNCCADASSARNSSDLPLAPR